ncbi:hypothetical protein DL546_003763 [Coniochaeta pulveracea]|uniref:Ubiquitin-conjugating enzyme E2 2 n=1 Tax=Coniochaeta pulveracea TaxID=177199 RepID=A0A420Y7Y9_9PEZI|nr:hypothetical protein DL546_003763 [Coniochaeta pulveracea]
MSSSRDRRILKELADMHGDCENSGVSAEPVDASNLTHLKGTFTGPPDTVYAGGRYQVDIRIPDMYPFKPPIMKMDTKIWHPNVSSVTGAICLDTLGSGWSPVGTIKTVLISLRMLLEVPNPSDPQDAQVAAMMVEAPDAFNKKAHDWAVEYAGAPMQVIKVQGDEKKKAAQPKKDDPARFGGYHPDLVNRFVSMGFAVEAVVNAFNFVGIERNGGEDYELEEAYMGDITARLLDEF